MRLVTHNKFCLWDCRDMSRNLHEEERQLYEFLRINEQDSKVKKRLEDIYRQLQAIKIGHGLI